MLACEGGEVEILTVPHYPQTSDKLYCFVYSMKMCMEYFHNYYNESELRDGVPQLDVQDIASLTATNDVSGTMVTNQLMTKISKRTPALSFTLSEGTGKEVIDAMLEKDLPVIVLYDYQFLMEGRRSSFSHAGVVVGSTDDMIILNNPWEDRGFVVAWDDFSRAWEVEYNRLVSIKPRYVM